MKFPWRIYLPVFVSWSVFRLKFQFPETIDELIIKPLIFIGLPLFLIGVRKKLSGPTRNRLVQGLAPFRLVPGFENRKGVFEDLMLGVGTAFIFAFAALAANKLKYGVVLISPQLSLAGTGTLLYLLLSVATSVSEEILGRGFFFNKLKNKSMVFMPAVISSIMMITLHLPIILTQRQFTGQTLVIYLCSIFLLSMTNVYIYKIRGNLVLPVLIHAFWNMTVAIYL